MLLTAKWCLWRNIPSLAHMYGLFGSIFYDGPNFPALQLLIGCALPWMVSVSSFAYCKIPTVQSLTFFLLNVDIFCFFFFPKHMFSGLMGELENSILDTVHWLLTLGNWGHDINSLNYICVDSHVNKHQNMEHTVHSFFFLACGCGCGCRWVWMWHVLGVLIVLLAGVWNSVFPMRGKAMPYRLPLLKLWVGIDFLCTSFE